MPWIAREEPDANYRLLADVTLERDGLRRSLEMKLKGEDGMIPVAKCESSLTPQGVRVEALWRAIHFAGTQTDASASSAEVVGIAKTFEDYLNGVSAPEEKESDG